MTSVLSAKHFHDEATAYEYLEAKVWPQGAQCPHCGEADRISKMNGESTRIGVYKCYQCRKQFRVTVGTVFEASHVKLHLWLQAVAMLTASKKGISSNQLHRTLGVSLKTAWFMSHRIREAMRSGDLAPMGGNSGIVEIDETYHGKTEQPHVSPQRRGRPTRKAHADLGTSALSCRWSSAAGRFVPSMSRMQTRQLSTSLPPEISRAKPACLPMKANFTATY